jgi:hypothetical protein
MPRHAGFRKRKCRLEGSEMRSWDSNSSQMESDRVLRDRVRDIADEIQQKPETRAAIRYFSRYLHQPLG